MRSVRAPPSGRRITTPTMPTFAPTSDPHVTQQSAVSTRMTDVSVDAKDRFESQNSNKTSVMPIDASPAAQCANVEACYRANLRRPFAMRPRISTVKLISISGKPYSCPQAPHTTTNDVQQCEHTDGGFFALQPAITQCVFHRQWIVSRQTLRSRLEIPVSLMNDQSPAGFPLR